MAGNTPHAPSIRGLKVVALFEAAKGLLILLVGFGLLAFIHRDLHHAAEQLVRQFHLNPAKHYPRIFIDAIGSVTNGQLWLLAGAALFYAGARFTEAVGLWLARPWAEWFGFITGGMYVPIEVYELMRRVTWAKVTILLVNLLIVIYLARVLYRDRKQRENAGPA